MHKIFFGRLTVEAKMTNQELIAKIRKWQNCGFLHPFTCGVDSLHPNLEPEEKGGCVVLVCKQPGCGYVQEKIPQCVLSVDLDGWEKVFSDLEKKIKKFLW